MLDSASAAPAPEAMLDLARWDTRFTNAETEARYQRWQVAQAVPFNRAGVWPALVAWLILIPLLWLSGAFLPWGPVGIFGVVPLLLLVILSLYRPRMLRWTPHLVTGANLVVGLTVVGIVNAHQMEALEATIGAVILTSYYGFAVLRGPPLLSVLAVAPYMLLELVELGLDFRGHRISFVSFRVDVLELTTAFVSGFLVNVVLDIVSRRSYRQERIIEAQKETIVRERARSEALLKSELSHQVAERSRELGDALSRVAAPVAQSLPAPGDRFHLRYRVVRALGEGGMGAVFEVERLTDGERLALKLVTGQVSGATAARFAREAEIGARVHHANIVSIVDLGIAEGGAPFLVMELVRGGSLDARRERFGDVAWGLPILRQIALGLSALHDTGVVHRDLKPGNVLLDGDAASTVAKISDFGISRFGWLDQARVDPAAPTVGADTPRKPDLTGTGVLIGTPLYMAPEAARGGRSLDAAADVFALGILAYELLTGRVPFEPPAVLVALAGQPLPVPPPIEAGGIPATLREAILACLSEDPKRRPTTRQFAELLGAIQAGALESTPLRSAAAR